MAHEINQHDHVVPHREKAWHGLGTIVQDAPTPSEALQIARLDWTVEQWPLSASNGEGKRIALPDQVLNLRSDTLTPLGVVTNNYQPIQNSELADFCQLLAEQGDTVKIESAGSIRNGAKVWFLLKGESFSVRQSDEIAPYILVSNGHDGGTALRCTPTTIRVVCSNTLHMVIPRTEKGGRLKAQPSCYVQAAAKEVTRESVQSFFLQCYTRDFGSIAANPKNKSEEKVRSKSQDAYMQFSQRFDSERALAGTTAWNAFNAYTGWLQNDRGFWKDAEKEVERRISSKLFGQDSDRAVDSLMLALAV